MVPAARDCRAVGRAARASSPSNSAGDDLAVRRRRSPRRRERVGDLVRGVHLGRGRRGAAGGGRRRRGRRRGGRAPASAARIGRHRRPRELELQLVLGLDHRLLEVLGVAQHPQPLDPALGRREDVEVAEAEHAPEDRLGEDASLIFSSDESDARLLITPSAWMSRRRGDRRTPRSGSCRTPQATTGDAEHERGASVSPAEDVEDRPLPLER